MFCMGLKGCVRETENDKEITFIHSHHHSRKSQLSTSFHWILDLENSPGAMATSGIYILYLTFVL